MEEDIPDLTFFQISLEGLRSERSDMALASVVGVTIAWSVHKRGSEKPLNPDCDRMLIL